MHLIYLTISFAPGGLKKEGRPFSGGLHPRLLYYRPFGTKNTTSYTMSNKSIYLTPFGGCHPSDFCFNATREHACSKKSKHGTGKITAEGGCATKRNPNRDGSATLKTSLIYKSPDNISFNMSASKEKFLIF
jgi:hypothetical protein